VKGLEAMRQTTLCLLMQGKPPEQVLLGFKKEGFGQGKYTGFGGKLEPGETLARAAIRELEEETGVRVREEDLEPMGRLEFHFPAKPAWSQAVYVFAAWRWWGRVRESREMRPAWFPVLQLPFEQMWQDGAHWLPRILAGESIQARFIFHSDNETIRELEIRSWDGTKCERMEGGS
jgi:8-oxo-dGTP pyrophosphatase MutT (NUDIX family)